MRVTIRSSVEDRARVNHVVVDGVEKAWWKFRPGQAIAAPATANFAAVAMLPAAMRRGTGLHIGGVVDQTLLENLEDLVDAWTLWRPDLYRHIKISADEFCRYATVAPHGAALTFSGGVDATFALVANQTRLLGHRSRSISHGLVVHGFDIPLDRDDWYQTAYAHAASVLRAFDVMPVEVSTNWRACVRDWEMEFGFGVASILQQMDATCSAGLWAADEPYDHEIIPWGSNSISNPLLSGSAFPVRAVGMGYSRNQKVAELARFDVVRQHLRVCWRHPINSQNCGQCEKCVRTRLNFLCAGVAEVPALGGSLCPQDILQLKIEGDAQADMLAQILKSDGERLPHELRDALANRLGVIPPRERKLTSPLAALGRWLRW